MPTRRQTIVGGTGGGIAVLTWVWFLLQGDDSQPESDPSNSSEQSDPDDEDEDTDGDSDGTGSAGDPPVDPAPKFTVAADVERRDRVRINHEITVVVEFENVGDAAGKTTYDVTQYRVQSPHFQQAASGTVSLKPGETETVTHVFGFERAGTHVVQRGKDEIDRFYVYPTWDPPGPSVSAGGDGEFAGGEEQSAPGDQ